MQIGFNFTLGETTAMVQQLVREGAIDYVELLIDNFLHVPPEDIARAFDAPVAFHIMFSRFLEADEAFLHDLASRLQPYIQVLRPMYVSDHIAYFSHQGRVLFHIGEIEYLTEYEHVRSRVMQWQAALGCVVHFENYPSIVDGSHDAPAFFERLMNDTDAGTLFDVSNAICAQRNAGPPISDWVRVMRHARHFHVSSYNTAFVDQRVTVDSHDGQLADDTLDSLRLYRHLMDKPGATLTYERDENIEYDSILQDLITLRTCYAASDKV
ncbi:methanobactin biosynthesis protein MbnB [Chitinivorax sp. B]|uniref:methanobactin biosynthesis protein MbnB n=1 Tax=Chitinivorax sp. B TaxID=2502235 RepID=UPI0010F483E9|nr:methanobactin biosynthesis protein MbnB [Chitinivorax sp. B]